jgi:hypothetical protein
LLIKYVSVLSDSPKFQSKVKLSDIIAVPPLVFKTLDIKVFT